jgi:thiamine monophosphate kinase
MKQITPPLGRTIYDMVMGDSDDYELIITCSPENVGNMRSVISSISDINVSEVGRITPASEGIQSILSDNSKERIIPKGWDHFV